MLFALWSAKGGVGVTTTAVGLASVLAGDRSNQGRSRRARPGVLLVDLGGDLPASAGIPPPDLGLTDWLGVDADADALARVEVPISRSIDLLGLGSTASWAPERVELLFGLLAADPRSIVIDVGVVGHPLVDGPLPTLRTVAVDRAETSLLVTRPCYLALRRAVALVLEPDGVVLVREPGRALDRGDVEGLLSTPIVAEVDLDPAIARLVDAGLLVRQAPRHLDRALRRVA